MEVTRTTVSLLLTTLPTLTLGLLVSPPPNTKNALPVLQYAALVQR